MAIDRRHLHRLIYVIGVGVEWGGVKEKKAEEGEEETKGYVSPTVNWVKGAEGGGEGAGRGGRGDFVVL